MKRYKSIHYKTKLKELKAVIPMKLKDINRKFPTGFPLITIKMFASYGNARLLQLPECCFPKHQFPKSRVFDDDSIWIISTFRRYLKEYKKEMALKNKEHSMKKDLLFLLFFINTAHPPRPPISFMPVPIHLIRLYMLYWYLEEFINSANFRAVKMTEEEILLYRQIKRRIFNNFYYFRTGPELFNYYLKSLELFISENKTTFQFNLSNEELDWFLKEFEERKSEFLFQLNQQYHYLSERKVTFPKTDSYDYLAEDLSPSYLAYICKKNKYKLNTSPNPRPVLSFFNEKVAKKERMAAIAKLIEALKISNENRKKKEKEELENAGKIKKVKKVKKELEVETVEEVEIVEEVKPVEEVETVKEIEKEIEVETAKTVEKAENMFNEYKWWL